MSPGAKAPHKAESSWKSFHFSHSKRHRIFYLSHIQSCSVEPASADERTPLYGTVGGASFCFFHNTPQLALTSQPEGGSTGICSLAA